MEVQQSNGGGQSAAHARPKVQLHVKPEKGNGPTEWSVSFDKDPPRGEKVEVDIPGGSPPTEIVFHLVGGGQAIRFDMRDPIWVIEGESCPRAPSSHDEIKVLRNESEPKKLVILDENETECVLSYQLNFIGAGPCDPMIRNGGPA